MQPARGIAAATGAYIIWGIFPLYWKMLEMVPAYEILCHRMAWSLVLMVCLLTLLGRLRAMLPLLRDRRVLQTFFLSSTLLAVNWLVYIWAVNSCHIVEASLGYFINPLVSVLFGVYFLKERLRREFCHSREEETESYTINYLSIRSQRVFFSFLNPTLWYKEHV